jgi:hypothetical protein
MNVRTLVVLAAALKTTVCVLLGAEPLSAEAIEADERRRTF